MAKHNGGFPRFFGYNLVLFLRRKIYESEGLIKQQKQNEKTISISSGKQSKFNVFFMLL